jgi:hypothetical protein
MLSKRDAKDRLAGEVARRSAPSPAFAGGVRVRLILIFPSAYVDESAIGHGRKVVRFS